MGLKCLAKGCANWNGVDQCAAGEITLGPAGTCRDYSPFSIAAPPPARAGAGARGARSPGRSTLRTATSGSVTYRLEMVSCGKCKKCQDGPSHGPYWYAYWKENGRTRSRYIGKGEPVEV